MTDQPPSSSLRRTLAVAAGALSIASAGVFLILDPGPGGAQIIANGAFVAVGTLIVFRRSGNVVGPLLIAFGLGFQVNLASSVMSDRLSQTGANLAAGWLGVFGGALFFPTAWLLVALLLYFPDGLPSGRWARRLLVGSAVYSAVLTVVGLFATPQVTTNPDQKLSHPFLDDSTADSVLVIAEPLILVIVLAMLAAVPTLVTKWRRGDAVQRRQVGWLLSAGLFYVIVAGVNTALNVAGVIGGDWFLFIDAIGVITIPIAIGIAIMRYRLYDIDLIISKSLTYLGLAAAISVVYAAIVVVPLLAIGLPEDRSPGLVLPILATAVAAVAFEPIRARMQRWANRVVYGDRASPQEVLAQVTSRLSENAAGKGTHDLAELLAQGTGAEQAVVWILDGDLLRPEGVFGGSGQPDLLPIRNGALIDDDLRAWRPVRHLDVTFGAVSITKPRNDPITPDDRALLANVAAGAGLVLRNINLNLQLEQRAIQVRESRRRLLTAQDAERHRLERDLHDGAQQRVVALKVKLGIGTTMAEREGAPEIASLLSAAADQTQLAVDSLRTVAHGIYPPLLESEGLVAALRAVERSFPIPIRLDTHQIERYRRPIEETVYFCVVETFEQARMAGAEMARIRTHDLDGELVVEVALDHVSREPDLAAVRDRADAFGGEVVVDAGLDEVMRITTSIPTTRTELEPA